MARPLKQGIDYFPLDVVNDDKLKFIEIKFKLEGFAIVIKLYQRIYSNGYYCNATEDEILLISDEFRIDYEKLNSIIEECLKREIFNKDLFDKYKILTSNGIQKRYFEAVQRRKSVDIIDKYMLFNGLKTINVNKNIVNVNINSINDNTMPTGCKHDVSKSTQSKVNKTKVNKKESKVNEIKELIDKYTSNEDLIDSINGFIEMRKAIKKPLTDRALKIMLNKLSTLASTEDDKIKILENSIMNNWQGIFALKEQDKVKEVVKPKEIEGNTVKVDLEKLMKDMIKGE